MVKSCWADGFWKWDGGDVSIYKRCQGFASEISEVKVVR